MADDPKPAENGDLEGDAVRDLSSLSDVDIKALLFGKPSTAHTEVPAKLEAKPVAKPNGEPKPAKAEEAKEALATEAKADTESAAVDEEPEAAAPLDVELEKERIARERLEAELDRQRLLADRNAGVVSNLHRMIRELQEARTLSDDEGDEEARPRRAAVRERPSEAAEEIAELRAERAEALVDAEGKASLKAAGDYLDDVLGERKDEAATSAEQKFMSALKESIQKRRDELQFPSLRGDPKLAQVTARAIFRSALADAKLALLDALSANDSRALSERKRATKEAKKAAGIATSSVPKQPEHAAASKQPWELTNEELAAEVKRLPLEEL